MLTEWFWCGKFMNPEVQYNLASMGNHRGGPGWKASCWVRSGAGEGRVETICVGRKIKHSIARGALKQSLKATKEVILDGIWHFNHLLSWASSILPNVPETQDAYWTLTLNDADILSFKENISFLHEVHHSFARTLITLWLLPLYTPDSFSSFELSVYLNPVSPVLHFLGPPDNALLICNSWVSWLTPARGDGRNWRNLMTHLLNTVIIY